MTILFTIVYIKFYHIEGSTFSILKEAFNSSGAEHLNSEVYIWSRGESWFGDFSSLKKMAEEFETDFGIIQNDLYSQKLHQQQLCQQNRNNRSNLGWKQNKYYCTDRRGKFRFKRNLCFEYVYPLILKTVN